MEPWCVTTAQRCRHTFVVKNYDTFYTRFTSCVLLFPVMCSPTKIVNPICRTNFIYLMSQIRYLEYYGTSLLYPLRSFLFQCQKKNSPHTLLALAVRYSCLYECQLLELIFIYRLFFFSSHQYLRINFKKMGIYKLIFFKTSFF